MKLKKITAVALASAMSLALLSACGNNTNDTPSTGSDNNSAEPVVLKVGATPAPHAEILEVVKPILAEQNIDLEITVFNDYVTPNTAVEDGSLDANYFQHITYMNGFNESDGTHLVSVGNVHYEPLGLYAGKVDAVTDLADGAQIAVPNDTTNEARALLLLQQEGLITLKEGAGINATKADIVENPKNLDIVELEANQLPVRLQDVDMAVINGNYAIDAGLNVADALAIEDSEGEAGTAYANVLVVKEGHENDEAIQALYAALCSDEVRTYMEETYGGAVVPLF
ncbi:MAG: MetQ/NlpA family ABC transporter substrate-binding protein [Candidatus Pseudoscilispira sp.]|nr:MetQ/NlpA family ABC transporter substrate-binding protein [bacterium 210917-SL.2.15]MDY4036853.1 MetQ/NlpA family ABC transporter substrate-binding protein [Candidatus Pseudoscilispira sp.]